MHDILNSYLEDDWIAGLKKKCKESNATDSKLSWQQGIIRYKNRISVGSHGNWRRALLREVHD